MLRSGSYSGRWWRNVPSVEKCRQPLASIRGMFCQIAHLNCWHGAWMLHAAWVFHPKIIQKHWPPKLSPPPPNLFRDVECGIELIWRVSFMTGEISGNNLHTAVIFGKKIHPALSVFTEMNFEDGKVHGKLLSLNKHFIQVKTFEGLLNQRPNLHMISGKRGLDYRSAALVRLPQFLISLTNTGGRTRIRRNEAEIYQDQQDSSILKLKNC